MPSRAQRDRGLERRRRERDRVVGRWGQLVADLSASATVAEGAAGAASPGTGPGPAAGVAGEVVRWRRRAERAEAELADLRRASAVRLLELGREAVYWRLRAEGCPHGEASRRAAGWWPDGSVGGR